MAATRGTVLSLYARIMRLHRRLPGQMRELGDAYVREEFKRHKAADAKFVAGFLQQWQTYTEQLSQQPPGHFGADLDTTDAKLLNDEQREQLEVLRTEVMSAAAATGDPEGSSGSQPLP